MKETLKNQKGIDTMEKMKAPTRKEMFAAVSDFLAEHDADVALIRIFSKNLLTNL